MPHILAVVQEVDRRAEPEREIRFFVLYLVSVRRERGVADGSECESDARGSRNQKTRPGDQKTGQRVIGELAPRISLGA
jgi:hypothetical protein